MKTRIISAFPGMGKSFVWSMNMNTCLDLEINEFYWLKKPGLSNDEVGTNSHVKNPDFLKNYLLAIKQNIGKYEFIFISINSQIREALIQECIFFYLVYPVAWMKDEYLQRYAKNNNLIIDEISEGWDDKINELICFENNHAGHSNWITSNLYLSEVLQNILISENDVVQTKLDLN